MSKQLGGVLISARKHLGWTQEALARRLRVSRAAIGQWESGSDPSTDNLIRVCAELGIEVQPALSGTLQHVEGFQPVRLKETPGLAQRSIEDADEVEKHPFNIPNYFVNNKLIPFYASHSDKDDPYIRMSSSPMFMAPRPRDAPQDNAAYTLALLVSHMEPELPSMSLVYVDGTSLPQLDDLVLIRLNDYFKSKTSYVGTKAHGMQFALVGRLIDFSPQSLTIAQTSPAGSYIVDLVEIAALNRIGYTQAAQE